MQSATSAIRKPEMATDSSIGASRWRRMSTVMSAKAVVKPSAERSPDKWPPPIAIVPATVMVTPAPAIKLPISVHPARAPGTRARRRGR
jgi:hypothetical protein